MAKPYEKTGAPEKNIPMGRRALTLAITAILYTLVAVSSVSVLCWQVLSQSYGSLCGHSLHRVLRVGFFIARDNCIPG
jgi:hypothetical protein